MTTHSQDIPSGIVEELLQRLSTPSREGLSSHDIPDCIVEALTQRQEGLTDADYHLAGAGRALAFVRMAADALENLGNELRVAEYHAYAGISAARTAIDATASWLRLSLKVEVKSLVQVDLKRKDYRKKVIREVPTVRPCIEPLGKLANVIDEHRQRAQHREGLALRFHLEGKKKAHRGGWYLARRGEQYSPKDDVYLSTLLRDWADRIERGVCSLVAVLPQ